jgi:hypothetical protein
MSSLEPRSNNGLGFVLAPFKIQPRNPSSWKAAVAYLPSMLFQQTLTTGHLVRAGSAVTLVYRANGPLDLEDLFGPVSAKDDLAVESQSIEGEGKAR